MIKTEDVINSVMGEFNSMNMAEKRAYLDHIGLKYTIKESGKARESLKIEKIDPKHSRVGVQSRAVSASVKKA